jgi:hypothetical protein
LNVLALFTVFRSLPACNINNLGGDDLVFNEGV